MRPPRGTAVSSVSGVSAAAAARRRPPARRVGHQLGLGRGRRARLRALTSPPAPSNSVIASPGRARSTRAR